MKKTLSRSLIGGAVLLACSQVHAATVSRGTDFNLYSSTQGNAAAAAINGASSVNLNRVTVTPSGSGYVDGDIVTITYSAGSLRLGSVGTVGDAASDLSCRSDHADATTEGFKLELTEVSSRTVKYKVKARNSAVLPSTVTCRFGGTTAGTAWQMLNSSLTASTTVTMSYEQASANGTVQDVFRADAASPTNALTLHLADTQYSETTLGGLETLISPAATSTYGARQRFVADADTGTTATQTAFAHTFTSNKRLSGGLDQQNKVDTSAAIMTVTYTGDFSFLDNNGNGCTSADLTGGWARVTAAAGVTRTISADCTVITSTPAAAGDRTDTLTFTLANAGAASITTTSGAKALNEQEISTVATWRTAGGTTLGTASPAFGGPYLTVQGFSAEIPYMPYGAGISRIIYITNRGSSGAVSFSAVNEAGTSCSTGFPAVTAAAGRVTLLSTAIDAGIASCYGADYTGKVRITVNGAFGAARTDTVSLSGAGDLATVGASAELEVAGSVTRRTQIAEIYSAYNVNGNRITVINTSNGR